ncbi:N-acetylglucosamine-6-phosphate deacetylase [Saccharibacillus sp. O23]|uniref:N-acetylglucosamine-6-phosphate deacetylase n=1 Tax=Saccharibacillus sp. O23 TaxID=2009338 RepID=UPI000B4E0CD4|nr:N-acetylglucosamine-6-phosphate deacetylase [Saccharibacillus sp. O23]OWR29812.1 N-acetylglucosamine-6-phosphate deacetylase [Saccharibacillus sp. O23]
MSGTPLGTRLDGRKGLLKFVNANIVTPDGIVEGGSCLTADGWIVSVDPPVGEDGEETVGTAAKSGAASGDGAVADNSAGSESADPSGDVRVVDAQGGWLLPGFVDIHVHGGMGEDFMDAAKPGVLDTIAKFHGSHGSTSMLATTMTATRGMIDGVLEAVWAYRQRGEMPGASIEGVHLEGPFISPKWPGAQNPAHISPPRTDWLEDWEARFPGLIRQVTLAPEREGAPETVAWLRANGITAAMGHTDASYEEVLAAVEAGLNHAVHTFNAMTPLHHRKPGAAGAALGTDAIAAEVIADGIHVHPGAVKLLAKVKTDGNLVLVTDAMSAAGLGDGDYFLGDMPVVVKDGVALTQGGALAGSRLTMAEGFRFLVREAGLSVERASDAASGAPARQAGLYAFAGSIQPGKRADFVWMDEALELRGVWAAGRKIG